MTQSTASCEHFDLAQDVTPNGEGCLECLAMGDTWDSLRLCLICGNVGCCDDSKNTHATRHYHSTEHPIMRSFQPGESWMWCFIDKITVEPS